MKELAALMLAACLLCFIPTEWSVDPVASASAERPTVNVPMSLRQANWLGPRREGSCSIAALCTGLQWFDMPEKAYEMRTQCGDGQTPKSLAMLMAKHDINFAWTVGENDFAFIEQALADRRAVMVCINENNDPRESHMVLVAHYDADSVCLIDSNVQGRNRWWSRDKFDEEWAESGSWAVCPLGTPCPPLSR